MGDSNGSHPRWPDAVPLGLNLYWAGRWGNRWMGQLTERASVETFWQ